MYPVQTLYNHRYTSRVVTSAKEVIKLAQYVKTKERIVMKFSPNIAHGPRKIPLNFGGDLDPDTDLRY